MHYREALAIEPTRVEWRIGLGRALTGVRRRAEGVAEYRRALTLDSQQGEALVELAWLLATAPEPALHNPDEAATLAQRAVPIVGGDHPVVLDTLAAVYASAGQFDRAIATARRAASRASVTAGFESRASDIEARVQLYLMRRVYRLPD